MTLAQINALDHPGFVDALGGIYEHSPWVAEGASRVRPFQSPDQLREAMQAEVESSGQSRQLDLLRAHPDLGTRARIGEFSAREQQRAGLGHLTADEYEILMMLNRQYREKFGFPFIYAVRGSDKSDILVALQIRLDSEAEEEFRQALFEVHRIAAFRLADLIKPQ